MEQPATNDRQLLDRYASEGSQAAFSTLIERHIKLVYSTCYRELHQRELAEEATQAVFITLAQKARSISPGSGLAAWLYTTARFKASALAKKEQRRMIKEWQAAQQASYERTEDEAWSQIEPALNDCLSALPAADQQAILLRFFDEMSFRELAQELGVSDDAAQKRVSRALEKLRAALMNRKAAVASAPALAALLTARSTYAVPAHLPASVAQSAGAMPAQLFRPLNPLLAKGLLIVSTTKIAAVSAAVVVLLLALIFFAVHRAHPQTANGSWVAGGVANSVTEQTMRQIQTIAINALTADLSLDQRTLERYTDPASWRKMQQSNVSRMPGAMNMMRNLFPSGYQLAITKCDIVGNKATIAGELIDKDTQTAHLLYRGTFVNSGGKWLVQDEGASAGRRNFQDGIAPRHVTPGAFF